MKDLQQTAFGLKDGRMYPPSEVLSGLACGCTCVDCGAQLVAKKGKIKRWHFAHHLVEIGPSCAESAIHMAAKQVLLDQNWLCLPPMRVSVSRQALSGAVLEETSRLSSERIVRFERSCAEVWLDGIRPDVIGYRGERKLLVEMYFRHRVDQEKRDKLAQVKLPAIEIDLSDLDVAKGFDGISARVLQETAYKSWLYFPNEEQELLRLQTQLAKRIKNIDTAHITKQANEQRLRALREQKQAQDQARQAAAHQSYRQMSVQDKEQDLRVRLGISGRWPYYLRKEGSGSFAIADPTMIWQGALFSRFIFGKANGKFILHHDTVLKWLMLRFETRLDSPLVVNGEVKRYLGYLSACGFLKKLPHNPYESQGYIVVHGELEPPLRREQSALSAPLRPISGKSDVPEKKPARRIWVWRSSWPQRAGLMEAASELLAGSEHAVHLKALLQTLSPLSRPSDPLDCASALVVDGVPAEVVMSFLNKLGLILTAFPGQTWER